MDPLVYILIINYNGYKDTIECVKSLEDINYNNFKIVIIDNNSTNNSEAILREHIKNHTIMQTNKNLGFAGGNNYGIKYALKNNAEYVLLLNNDTVVNKDFLAEMIKCFKYDNSVGIAGCKIMYYGAKDRIWFAGGKIDWYKFQGIHEKFKLVDNNLDEKVKDIDFMTGCSMLIKKDVFNKVGLLPEDYFMYFEDVDFCVKVKKMGFKILYNPKAIIYHKSSISSGGEDSPLLFKYFTRNRLIFMNKYKYEVNAYKFFISKSYFYITRYIKIIKFLIYKDKLRANAIIEGLREGKDFCKNIT